MAATKLRRINWQEIEKKANESLEDMYYRFFSTRKMADFISKLMGYRITFNPILEELGRRGVDKRRGGAHNIGPQRAKSGYICQDCKKDAYPNRFRCPSCANKIAKIYCEEFI